MDLPKPSRGGGGTGGDAGRASRFLFRCFSSLILSLAASFLFSFLLGLLGLAIEELSASAPLSVPSTCRILSSSVDIRTSKICELGMFNYKAKHVFYPSEKTKFRCRYDYYWASVFEVEYKEYFSSHLFHSVAEVPKEALPEECRPSFGAAWSTRMKFKVNETYNCRYIPGSQRADIFLDDLFYCQAKEPSITEMIRRYFTLFRRLYHKQISGWHVVYSVAGVISGVLISIFVVILLKIIHLLARASARKLMSSLAFGANIVVIVVQLRRVCLSVAYLCAMCWLTLHYGEMIGLKRLIFNSEVDERTP
ncbi:hypothetical protein OPV22_009995 [Ensete ventricosum]|uniref:Uncharacterized protein n=1 Tax=Ensete ventricosum TaxID=4639 RepID=A0AAV8RH60_ENSVE|nr:hypothetical protein OPV22_009995 [Ensete ventricosum]